MNFKKILILLIKKIFAFSASLIRMLILGIGSVLLVLYSVDNYTKSEYGIENLYIILGALSFFPVFISIFFESFILFTKSSIKKIKKQNTAYLQEQITKE